MSKAGSSRVRETLKMCSIITATAIVVALAVPAAVDAAGSFVTIEDADSTNRAQVDNGKVRIGDGDANPNSLTVNGLVTGREAPPAEMKRFGLLPTGLTGTCRALATPAAGKALVITEIVVNTSLNPSPGSGDSVAFLIGTECSGHVLRVNPPGIGATNIDLGPGITVPNGSKLFIFNQGENLSDVYAFGYQVAASQVPAASAQTESPAPPPQQQQR